jgi:sec-independent protein translocase protein TatA
MGVGSFEMTLIFLVIVLLFGTKKLSSIGADLGGAIRDFKMEISL